jgi:hypothetical protein
VLALADRLPILLTKHERQRAMHSGNASTLLRRSSRVPTAVQILVTSLDGKHFSDVCETLVVNAHGCAIRTQVKLEAGVPLHFHSKEGRDITARVVTCQPIDSDHRSWILGAKLDHPENFWGLRDCPKDWALPSAVLPTKAPQSVKVPNTRVSHDLPGQVSPTSEAMLERARQSEARMKKMILELVRPLQAEILALRERLSQREANPGRFEVSLSSIPPELEQQIESRVRSELGPRLQEEARVQSLHLLASAKALIDQQTSEAYENIHRMMAGELQVIEKRAQDISEYISRSTREHLRCGLEEFHQKLLDGGNALKRLGEELLEFLQQNLNAEHDARRADLEKLRAAIALESARFEDQMGYLDTRIGKLDQSARCLESGLDQRLSRISSDTIRDTRMQFESAANEILEELTARSIHLLRGQLDETSGNMKSIQEGIVASATESFKGQAGDALLAFEGSVEHVARLSVERWRLKLEGGLYSLAKSLNEQFQSETGGGVVAK